MAAHSASWARGLRRAVRGCIVLLIAMLSPTGVDAQPAAQPSRLGLVIGNANYTNPKDVLPGARRDAETIKTALEKVGFRVRSVHNADRRQLEAAVKEFQSALQKEGTSAIGVLYYAGHGGADPERNDNYLLPVDVDSVSAVDVKVRGVGLRWIIEVLRKLDQPRAIVIVVDACRTTAPEGADQGSATGAATAGSASLGMADPDEPDPGHLIAFSTSKGRPASDSGRYAQVLANKLVTDGLTITQVFDQVLYEVVGNQRTGQIPISSSTIDKPLCLVSCEGQGMRETVERIVRSLKPPAQSDELFRQELDTTRAEMRDLRRRLESERSNAIGEILTRAGQREGAGPAALARASLEKGEVEAAEALLRTIESEAAARKDFREAARIARQIGGLASTHSVRLAVAAFRRAAELEPQNPENWRLVGGLWRRSTDLEDAQRAYEQLVALLSENAKRAPIDAPLQRELADGYAKLGSVLAQSGHHMRARAAFQSGVDILSAFIAEPRVASGVLDEFASLQTQLGTSMEATGDRQLAMDSYIRGLATYRRFGQSDKSGHSAALAIGDLERNLGGALLGEGNRGVALQHFRSSLAIHERLAEERPNDRLVLRGLGLAQRGVGFALVGTGDHAGANAAFNRALGTTQRLVAADAKDAVLRYDLARIHSGFGEAAMGQGDHLLAVRSFNNALATVAELVVLNPKRIPWQQEKLRANTRLADATASYGARDQAIATYRGSLLIQDELARLLKATGSKYERRNNAKGLDRVGDALVALKDHGGALAAFRNGLAVREDVLRSSPSDDETELDISVSCWKISAMKGFANVDAAEAESKLQRGKLILRKLREQGRLPKQFAELEQRFDAALQRAGLR